jgi:hypothetical protein
MFQPLQVFLDEDHRLIMVMCSMLDRTCTQVESTTCTDPHRTDITAKQRTFLSKNSFIAYTDIYIIK